MSHICTAQAEQYTTAQCSPQLLLNMVSHHFFFFMYMVLIKQHNYLKIEIINFQKKQKKLSSLSLLSIYFLTFLFFVFILIVDFFSINSVNQSSLNFFYQSNLLQLFPLWLSENEDSVSSIYLA